MAVTAVNIGTNSTVGIGTSGQTMPSGTFAAFGGVFSGTLSWNFDNVDTTNNDDLGATSRVYGNETATLSLEMRFDPTDSAQATLVTAANAKTVHAYNVLPIVASGEDSWSFEGTIESFELNPGENNEAVNLSLEIQSTGIITQVDQS